MQTPIFVFFLIISILFLSLFSSCSTDPHTPEDIIQSISDTTGSISFNPTIDLSAFSDNPDAREPVNTEYAFSFQALPTVPDVRLYADQIFTDSENHIYLKGYDRNTNEARIISFDADGQCLDTVPYRPVVIDSGEMSRAVYMREDGSFLYTTKPYPAAGAPLDAHGDLIHMSPDGTILAQFEIPGTSGADLMKIMPDGRIVLAASDSICFLDAELNLLCEVPVSANTILVSSKNEVLAQIGWLGQYTRIDTETYTSTPETMYEIPHSPAEKTLYFSANPSKYDVYYSDNTGLWGYCAGEDSAVLLCDWAQSGQNPGDVRIGAVLDETRFFVELNDAFNDHDILGFLCLDETRAAANAQKRKITLGFVDAIDPMTTAAVNQFNATQNDYYIETITYFDDNTGTSLPDAFTDAMLAHTAADIIVSSEHVREQMQTYYQKNAFVDLSDTVGTVLLPCARSAYTQKDGAVFAFPVSVKLSVFAAKTSILGQTDVLTLEKISELMQTADKKGSALFNHCTPKTLLAVAAPTFVNTETGECSYTSTAFAGFVHLYESTQNHSVTTGLVMAESGAAYYVNPPELLDQIQNNDFTLLEIPLYSIYAYPMLKLFYDTEDFSLHGYPANGKEIISMISSHDFSLNADSDTQYGAMLFLSYLLSDTIQTWSGLYNQSFPVTHSGMEALLSHDTFYFDKNLFLGNADSGYMVQHIELDDYDFVAGYESDFIKMTLTEADMEMLRKIFYHSEMQSLTDTTMMNIIEDEFAAYQAGMRSLADMQNIIQSRIFIYINE